MSIDLWSRVRPMLIRTWLEMERRGGGRFRVGFGQVLEHDLRHLLPSAAIVVDVGANRGQFAFTVLRAQPKARIYSLEPAAAAFGVLQEHASAKPRISAYQVAISTQEGEALLHIAEDDSGSSLLKAEQGRPVRWLHYVRDEIVSTIRLDTFCEKQLIDSITLLKSDTQGHDAEVLRSAGRLLTPAHVSAVLVEVNFEQFYEGQSQPHEIFFILESSGYRMAALYPHRGPQGPIQWADVLFLPSRVSTGVALDEAGLVSLRYR